MLFPLCSCHFKCSKSCLFHSLRLVTTSDIFSFVFLFGLNFFLSPKVVQTKKHNLFLSFPSKLKKKTTFRGCASLHQSHISPSISTTIAINKSIFPRGKEDKVYKRKIRENRRRSEPFTKSMMWFDGGGLIFWEIGEIDRLGMGLIFIFNKI